MKKSFLKLTRNSFFYLIAGITSAFIGILTLPLYTRFLTPNDYGIVAIVASITGFLGAFYTLGLTGAYGRFYFDYKDDEEELKKHISTIVLFLAIYGLVFSFLVISCKGIIEDFTKGIPFVPYILLAVLSGYFLIFFQIKLILYQIEQRAKNYTFLFIASIILQTVLTIYLVVFQGQGALGYIKAGFINSIIFAGISLWMIRGYLIPVIDIKKLKISLRYSLPIVPHLFAGWMLTLADRLILNNLVGVAETGLYSAGYKVAMIMNMAAASVNFAWSPYLYSAMKDRGDSAKQEIARFATYWVMMMCFIFLIISIFSKEIIAIFTASPYHLAYKVVPLIVSGCLFQGFYYIVVNPLFWKGKTPIIAVATMASGILNIGLNFLFIPKLQMMGAALATALSFLFCFIFIGYFSLKYLPFPYEYRRLFKILVVTGLCCLLWLYIPSPDNLWLSIVIKLFIVAGFPTFLVLTRFLKREEQEMIKNILQIGRQWTHNFVFKRIK